VPRVQDREAARRAQRPVRVALALLICIVVGLVAAGAFAAYRINSLGDQRFSQQAAPFFAVTEDLAVEMLNEETAVRGYVITHDPQTLAPYRQGRRYTHLELGLIAKDASFDADIPRHLAAMRKEVASLEAYFAHEIALVRSGPAGQKRAETSILAGKGHFDHLRTASAALIGDAGDVVKRSQHEQHRTLIIWLTILGLAGLAAVGIAAGLLVLVPRRLFTLFREERIARREAERGADAARALAHVREAVLLIDDTGAVRYANPAALTLFALAEDDLGSSLLRQLIFEVEASPSDGAPQRVTVAGRDHWLTSTRSDFDGGQVVVFRDVSEDHRLERLRSDFVATAAHELRTPLSAVYGAVRTLRRSDHDLPVEMQAQFLEMIETQSDRLRVLMDQLLVSAQLDAVDLRLQPQPVDAAAVCDEVIGAAGIHKPQDIALSLRKPVFPVRLSADPDRLQQVVANLIDNAVKYSPAGGQVAISVASDGRRGTIEVADQGLGIPADELERIFEKFYRLDPAMTTGVGGSGLGLYISRELVRQMGGELTVRSTYGMGSTFTITLPLHTTTASVRRPSLREREQSSPT
jgi:two-component system phosphate regulon sensor histidine kinase PhoR